MVMKRIVLIAFGALFLAGGTAAAQSPEGAAAEPALAADQAPPEAGVQPDPSAIRAPEERRMPPAGANLQEQCEDLLRSDAAWRTRLRDQLTQRLLVDDEGANELTKENLEWRALMKKELATEIHQQDADEMATNRKHVIMAYAALWVITALFIIYMYMRQVRLREEIARLERDIRDAARS
jgi:hypothetical protein